MSRPGPCLAIIMGGNGRWTRARGRSRTFEHQASAEAVRRTVEAGVREELSVLTLYAFSSDMTLLADLLTWCWPGRPREC